MEENDPFVPDINVVKKRKYIMKTVPLINSKGEKLSIPQYECFPKYIEHETSFVVKRMEPTPISQLEIKNVDKKPLEEKYYPKSYQELISDEKSNRSVLDWLRFFQNKKGALSKPKRIKKLSDAKNKKGQIEENIVEKSHILLLSGPSGCGKTALIRVIAKHCGYHTVELNASDDVSIERNQLLLQNQLNFEPVFGKKTRALLVLEELDGVGTINDSILKAITDLKNRPVAIVVNDMYSSSLRNIRQIATIAKMSAPTSIRIADRIKTICKEESIEISNSAITALVDVSRQDMRTCLNTLSFLSIKQPITTDTIHLTPVGVKNATLNPFDVWTSLFTFSTKYVSALETLEIFGENRIVSTGILENLENVKSNDPTRHNIAEMLDNLCYSDVLYGEYSEVALAATPRLVGITKIGNRQIQFPTSSISYETQSKKNQSLLLKHPFLRNNFALSMSYLNPSEDTINVVVSKAGSSLKKRIVAFHKKVGIQYKKNNFGHYISIPDFDSLIFLGDSSALALSKYREAIQHEIEIEKSDVEVLTGGGRISDKLGKKTNKPIRNFWGEELDIAQTQSSIIESSFDLIYIYNEGVTNAVKRKVVLNRILK